MVKMQPCAVCRLHDALGTQDDAVGFLVIERRERRFDLFCRELLVRLDAPALEDLVGIMPVMMVMMVVLVLLVMVMVAMLVVIMMMLVFLIMVVMVMRMIVIMMAAAVLLVFLLCAGVLDHLGKLVRQGMLVLHGF